MARNVFIDLIGRDRVSPVFDRAAASASAAASKMSAANAKMAKTGAAMTRGITVPLLAVAAVSTKVAIDYQKSMTLLQTAGGESAKKTAAIGKGLQDVAVKTGSTLKDLSAGMYIVAKAGSQKWSAAGQLDVMRAAAEGAKAENVDLGTATNALTSVMMSYHLGTSKAVAVQNELIVGAGRAKTTMQDYAGALSTVIPVASAVHISFAQVAGAIATMTQHGTSADEATQELSHTIRNLTSPNQVAQKAMQQLGLSVVDVTKNLGKRGLTGTIDLITNAIAKHMGPSGMIAVSAFKQSQSASADLNVELAHMPKNLQDISQQFESGKMSYKDYYKSVKDLGGQAFALGKGFLATFTQARGFNDLLKSGSPAARTFAGTLKNVMGTATGMNTALQLGGDNMKYFKTATDDVAAAAKKSGADVLGWGKTSNTLAVKMDKAKASLQVLALEIGNALIPAVSKIVQWVSKAVTWFSNLSGTDKAILGWSLAFLAAIGPILTITARLSTVASGISRFVAGVSSRLATLAGASELQATRVGVAMSRITAGLAGVGIGFAVGQFTKNGSATTKILGALGSAAAGAAIGFSMGGPMGAAIGGLGGGLSALATEFLGTGDSAQKGATAAQKAMQQQQADAQSLLGDLQAVNGAYNTQYRSQVASMLQQKGILDLALKVGISAKDLTSAALGSPAAAARVQAAMNQAAVGTPITSGPAAGGVLYSQAKADAANKLAQSLGKVAPAIAEAERKQQQLNAAIGKGVVPTTLLAGGLKNLGKEFGNTDRSLTAGTAEGIRNTAVLKENIGWVNQSARSQLAHGKSVKDVTGWLEGQVGALQLTTHNLGFNAKAVQAVIDKYRLTPAQIITKLVADAKPGQDTIDKFKILMGNIKQGKIPGIQVHTDQARTALAALQAYLDRFHDKNIKVTINQSTIGTLAKASGGWAFGPGTGTSDSINARLSNGEFVVRASRAKKYPGLLNRINNGPGFAGGGPVGFASGGAVTGTAKKTLLLHIQNADVNAIINALKGTASDTYHAFAALFTDVKKAGGSASVIAKVRDEEKKLYGIQQQRTAVTGQLTKAEAAYTAVHQKWLSTFQSAQSATLGSFDITTAGATSQVFNDRAAGGTSTASILTSIRAAVAKAGQFGSVLNHLRKRGVSPVLLSQLAAAGPAALAQATALLHSTPDQISSLNANYAKLTSQSKYIGGLIANDMYGAGVQSAQGLVNGLKSQQSALMKQMQALADAMVTQIKKSLGIKSPSSVMRLLGQHTGEGYRLGLVDRVDGIGRAGKDMANAATPSSQTGTWRRVERGGDTFYITETTSAGDTALAVQRRRQMAGYGSA